MINKLFKNYISNKYCRFTKKDISLFSTVFITGVLTLILLGKTLLAYKVDPLSHSNILIYEKPMLYMYSENEIDVSVKINSFENKISTIPPYDKDNNILNLHTKSDGEFIDLNSNKKYTSLKLNGYNYSKKPSFEEGFIIEGTDSEKFLLNILTKFNLNSIEINDFIKYWLPKLKRNEYNFITFLESNEAGSTQFEIIPEPDNRIQVFMMFKKINESEASILSDDLVPQNIVGKKRDGFTIVEWGGVEFN